MELTVAPESSASTAALGNGTYLALGNGKAQDARCSPRPRSLRAVRSVIAEPLGRLMERAFLGTCPARCAGYRAPLRTTGARRVSQLRPAATGRPDGARLLRGLCGARPGRPHRSSSKPASYPHQMAQAVEARIVELRWRIACDPRVITGRLLQDHVAMQQS